MIRASFFWKLRSICKFWMQNQFCAILEGLDIWKTKWDSGSEKYIFILTWSGPHCTRVALRCCDWPLSGLDTPWKTSWGNLGPLKASKGMTSPVRSHSGHLKATLVLWGPLQVSMNMYLSISEPRFVLQISQPPKIVQNWFCIQNLHKFSEEKRD